MSFAFWGLEVPKSKAHKLVLPKCTSLDFYRSDDLNHLKIWAPNLSSLNFQACYSISSVEILDRKPNGYSGPEYKFNGKPADYEVNFLNTDRQKGNITTHSRCKGIFPESNNIDDHMNVDPMEWLMP